MARRAPTRRPSDSTRGDGAGQGDDIGFWREHSRIALTPIAPPSILGLFGFSAATLIVAANMAGWYGNAMSPRFLFPFAAFFGGLAQFMAGMWSYRARDAIATAMHGTWGSFWMAYGVLFALDAAHVLTLPTGKFVELGFWFIALGAITWMGALAATFENVLLCAVLSTLAAGSTLAAIAFIGGFLGVQHAAGWVFVFSAGFAWLLASAMMLESAAGRVVIPLGKLSRAANTPGTVVQMPVQFERGMPGARKGQ
jgi:succinate-acetate transporter protein